MRVSLREQRSKFAIAVIGWSSHMDAGTNQPLSMTTPEAGTDCERQSMGIALTPANLADASSVVIARISRAVEVFFI